MKRAEVRALAERLYRQENPGNGCPFSRQPELSDLWPADQEAYVERARQTIDEYEKLKD